MIRAGQIPDDQLQIYISVIDAARTRGVPFAIGGAFGFGTYTGQWRNTKDLDVYVLPRDREAMIEIMAENGLEDYYERLPYDRRWIYRGFRDGTIVDAIWAMANQRAQVDERWLTAGCEVELAGERVRALPPEELIWAKLYVLQRDRSDWPDIFNVIAATGASLDWEHLLRRIGTDAPMLGGVLSVFRWIAPGVAASLPGWLWERVGLTASEADGPRVDLRNVALLDGRPWFMTRSE